MRGARLGLYLLCSGGLFGCMASIDGRPDLTSGTAGDMLGNGGGMGGTGGTGVGMTGDTGAISTGGSGMATTGAGALGDAGDIPMGGDTGGDDAGMGTTGVASNDVPAGAHCAPVAAWDPQWAQFEQEVLVLTNAARAKGHNCDSEGNFGPASALSMEPHLRCSARLHSQYMARVGDDFAHTQRETGLDPFERMRAAGYSFFAAGENIAVGQSSPTEVVNGWLDSDGHCANIMNPQFTQIGIGYDVGPYDSGFGPSGDAPYWTQNFGRPM